MLTTITAPPYTVRGVSIGGIYTSMYVPELSVMFDVGIPVRSFAGADALFLSHGHVDHVGALASFLGIRALVGKRGLLKIYLPAEIVHDLTAAMNALARLQRYSLAFAPVPLSPGDIVPFKNDLWIRAVKTFHPVPALGFQILRRTHKLRPEFHQLKGSEIRDRRHAGEDLFAIDDHPVLAYATDTLVQVLDNEPSLYQSDILVLECTFFDDRKPVALARAGCHIHLDEIIERADLFANTHLVLMHASQIYKPNEIRRILDARCPPALRERIHPFVPSRGDHPG